jgi:hypothetical protein
VELLSGSVRLDPARTEWRLVDGDVVGLDLVTEEYFTLTGTGALLWPQLQTAQSPEALTRSLVDAFDVGPDRASADVAAFLEDLLSRGYACADS